MSADLDALIALMPFAGHLGLVLRRVDVLPIESPSWSFYLLTP
jgi:hypothetical protein